MWDSMTEAVLPDGRQELKVHVLKNISFRLQKRVLPGNMALKESRENWVSVSGTSQVNSKFLTLLHKKALGGSTFMVRKGFGLGILAKTIAAFQVFSNTGSITPKPSLFLV